MATSYTGLRVQDTYNAIIKIGDNSNLTATPKLLSDGLGNDSPLYLSGTRLGIGVSPTYQFQTSGNAKIGGNLIIAGNLTVNGTTTIVDSTIIAIGDNMIELAKDNVSNTMDIGWYGTINDGTEKYVGVFYDASTGTTTPTFRIGLGTTEPGNTTSWTVKGKLIIGALDAATGTFSGAITTNLSAEGTYFTGGSGAVRQLSITSGTNISAHALHTFNIASSNGKYKFDIDGTEEFSLDSSNATFAGKIIAQQGIQITGGSIAQSTAVLHTNNILYLRGGSNGLFLQNADGSDGYYISNSDHKWEVNSSTEMRLNSTGLGLNGSTPAYTIDTGETTVGTLRMVGEDDHTFIRLGAGGGGNDVTLIRVDGDSTDAKHDGETDLGAYGFSLKYLGSLSGNENALALYADNSAAASQVESFRVKQDGTLDMGGSSIFTQFIKSNSSFRIDIDNDNNQTDRIFIVSKHNSGTELFRVDEDGDGTFTGHGLFQGSTGNAPTGSGTFVGLTNDYANLQLNGTNGSHIDFSTTEVDYKGRIIYFNSNNTFIIYTDATQALTIDGSQKATFKADVDIDGNLQVDGTIKDSDGDAGTSGQILSSTGSGTNWIDLVADSAKRLTVDVKNVHGATLSKGTVVHAEPTGTLSGNVIEVVAADANTRMPAIGILNEDLADDAEGEAVMFGTVQGIDTSGFSVGDELYVSATAGDFTATKPTATNEEVQKIAIVVKSSANNGLIKVFGAGRANDVPNQINRNIQFSDSSELRFGSSNDLRLYHNGTQSLIQNFGGNLEIRQAADDKDIIFYNDDGSGGITSYLKLDGGDERIYVNKLTRFADDVQLRLGDNNDIRLYHNSTSGNNNFENHTGSLYITNYADDEDIIFRNDNGSGDVIEYFRLDGSTNTIPFGRSPQIVDNVKLYFGNDTTTDASIKWDSTASQLFIDGTSKFLDDLTVLGGTATARIALSIGSSGATSYTLQEWQTSAHGTTEAYIIAYGADHTTQAGNFAIKNIEADGEIFFELASSVEPLRLTSTNATFAGNIGGSGNLNITGTTVLNNTLYIAEYIQHLGDTDTYIRYLDNRIIIESGGGAKIDFHSNGQLYLYGNQNQNGHIYPATDSTYDLGSTSSYWRNLYVDNIVLDGGNSNALKVYRGTATISNTAYTTIATVNGDNLASAIRLAVTGTSANVVINCVAEILVNHSTDILIKSVNGFYTRLEIKIVSDNNEDFAIELQRVDNTGNTTVAFEITPLGNEAITLTSSHSISGSTLEHVCRRGESRSSNDTAGYKYDSLFEDGAKIRLGDSGDLQLYHDGSNSYMRTSSSSAGDLYIQSQGTNHDLYLQAADDIFIRPQGGENGIFVQGNGGVALYHNNSVKFETTSAGTSTSGESEATRFIARDGNLLQLHQSSWNTGNTDHYVLYNAWRSSTGDYLIVKSSGNQSGGNGAILIGDGNSGRVYFGKHGNQSAAVDSATAPLDTTYAYIGGSANYFAASSSFHDNVLVTNGGTLTSNNYMSVEGSSSGAYIRFKHGTGGLNYVGSSESLTGGFGDENDMLNYSSSGKWGVYTNSSLALTIDESQNAIFAGDVTITDSATVGDGTVTTSTTNYENVLRVKGKNNYSDGTTWYGDYGQIILHSDTNMTGSARRFMITNALGNNKFAIVRSVDGNNDPVVNSTAGGNNPNSGYADFVIDNTGRIGLGYSTPNEKLTVSGNVNIIGTGGYLRWNSGDMAIVNAGSYAMAFQTYTGSSLTEKMRITSDGRIGIGTDPSYRMHIKQNTNANLVNLIEQDNASYEAWYEAKSQNSGYARFGISNDSNAYAFFNTSVTSYNWYHTAGGLLMTLNSNGHLGLGITNLTFAKLAVNGAVYSSGGTLNAGTDTVTNAAFVLDEEDWIYTRDASAYARKLIGKTSDRIQIGQSGTSLIQGIDFFSGSTQASYKWYRNTSVAMQLYGSGSQPYEILDVKGRIQAETDNGSAALISRAINITYRGATGTYDFDPVALFGATKQGGYILLEVNGWQTRFNAGYIHWNNNGGTGTIGTGSVTYRQIAWSGSASGAGVSVSTISSSTNVIRISFSGWHTNSHGWKATLIWRG